MVSSVWDQSWKQNRKHQAHQSYYSNHIPNLTLQSSIKGGQETKSKKLSLFWYKLLFSQSYICRIKQWSTGNPKTSCVLFFQTCALADEQECENLPDLKRSFVQLSLTRILLIAATISTRLLGRATSRLPMYCCPEDTIWQVQHINETIDSIHTIVLYWNSSKCPLAVIMNSAQLQSLNDLANNLL